MAKKMFVGDLVEGDVVQTTFLLDRKSIREDRNGEAYLRLTLRDRTGKVEGRIWRDVEMFASRVEERDFVALRGEVTTFADRLYLDVQDITRLDDDDVDFEHFFPSSRWDGNDLLDQLRDLVEERVAADSIRRFLHELLTDDAWMKRFVAAPAAKRNHHAWRGGLVEHVLSMTRLAVGISAHYNRYYPGMVDGDLVVAGCILHDIGKCEELSYEREFGYSTPGRLEGHISRGARLIDEIAARMDEPPGDDTLLHLRHLVLSHHGERSYGSPVEPKTAEAMLLHQIDMIDSRMNMCWNVFSDDADEASAEWTEYVSPLGTSLFRGGRGPDRGAMQNLTGPGRHAGDANLNLFDDD